MKLSTIALTIAATSTLAVAQPHRHHHRHNAKRSPEYAQTVDVPGPVVTLYELDGKTLAQSEVCKGIEDGSLKWAEGTIDPPQCDNPQAPAPAPTPVVTPTLAPSSTSVAVVSSTSAPLPAAPVSSAAPVVGNQFIQEAGSSSSSQESSAAPSSTQAASSSSTSAAGS